MSSRLATDVGKVKHFGNQRSLDNYKDLVIVLLQKELKVRYKNKLLGYLWSLANPLASALVFYIAFQVFLRVSEPNYALFLIAGLFPWQWLSNSVNSAPNLFVGSGSIIKKVNFPRNIVPLCAVLNHMIHFIITIPVILLFMVIYRQSPSLSWIYGFPILLTIQFVMAYGIALGLSSINLFFRDLERLTGVIMNFLFYFTPIIYDVDRFPERYRDLLIVINPATPLMYNWRKLILHGQLEPLYVLLSILYAILFFAIGFSIYKKLSCKFAELL
ncbi:MAG: ABC transporter permease [Cyanobacteria bacterium CRU_2_1]|nr:ABC transporter permease [Cyanobacteria bacterium RU_5_0]NJR63265.1 ABC transporter permease [Cyanobacteria bacterium CRU_2_1]